MCHHNLAPKSACLGAISGSKANNLHYFQQELVHTDVCGPIKAASLGGSRYFVTFIDDYSRMTAVYPIRAKSDVVDKFREYRAGVEKQLSLSIKAVRSDNGGEYIG